MNQEMFNTDYSAAKAHWREQQGSEKLAYLQNTLGALARGEQPTPHATSLEKPMRFRADRQRLDQLFRLLYVHQARTVQHQTFRSIGQTLDISPTRARELFLKSERIFRKAHHKYGGNPLWQG